MATFKDCLGREYTVSITVGKLKPLREMGLEIGKIATAGESLGTLLFGDPEKLVGALYLLTDAKVDRDDFDAGFDGPTMESAGEAILEAVCDFYPRSAVAARMKGRVKAALLEMDTAILAKMESSGSAGNSPASSESTPAI